MHQDHSLWYNEPMIQQATDTVGIQWASVFRQVSAFPPHHEFRVSKLGKPHPLAQGFSSASGYPKGALAQYSLKTSDGGRIHIRDYETYFTVHRDWGDPDSGLGGLLIHLINDSPEILVGLALLWLIVQDQQKKTSGRAYLN